MEDIKKEAAKEEVKKERSLQEILEQAREQNVEEIGSVSILDKTILPFRSAIKKELGEDFFANGGYIRAKRFEASFYMQRGGFRIRVNAQPETEKRIVFPKVEVGEEILEALQLLTDFEMRKRELLKIKKEIAKMKKQAQAEAAKEAA